MTIPACFICAHFYSLEIEYRGQKIIIVILTDTKRRTAADDPPTNK